MLILPTLRHFYTLTTKAALSFHPSHPKTPLSDRTSTYKIPLSNLKELQHSFYNPLFPILYTRDLPYIQKKKNSRYEILTPL